MKRCPECRRDYYDESLFYCLDDGNALLDGPASGSEPGAVATGFPPDEPQTAILHSTAALGEAPTRAQIHTTDQTAGFPSGEQAEPRWSLGDPTEKQSFSANRAAKMLAASIAAILVLVGGFVGYRYFLTEGRTINSIAVLPFANASGEKETEFLSDGLAETLINNLTKIPDLKVAARSSAFSFRGRESEPKEIGRQLGVGSVLTGRLLQRGDNVSIQVDLVSTSDGLQIWGEKYEGRASDIVSIQQRIATEVSQQLKMNLTGVQAQQMAKTYTQNAEAYQHYLRGRFYWNKRTGENLRLAIEEFRQAIATDPTYALAYVGLADSYALLDEYAGVQTSESLPQAKSFVDKALELEPNLAEAYASLGIVNQKLWKWDESEAAFKRAIELNPNYPTTYHWYSIMLRYTSRPELSRETIKKGAVLDPLSQVIRSNLATALREGGDAEASLAECRNMQSLDPNFIYIHECFGAGYLALERFDEAIGEYRKFAAHRNEAADADLGFALARAGREAEAREQARKLEEMFSQGRPNAADVARVYVALGDDDKVFEWLEKAFNIRDDALPDVMNDSRPALKSDPRYGSLMNRIGLK